MKEINRVMQPGGYGVIIVPTPHNMNKFHEDYTHVRPFTALRSNSLRRTLDSSSTAKRYFPIIREP